MLSTLFAAPPQGTPLPGLLARQATPQRNVYLVPAVDVRDADPLAAVPTFHAGPGHQPDRRASDLALTLHLQLVNFDKQYAAIGGAEVAVCLCDAAGSTAVPSSFCGVQFSSQAGRVQFQTVLSPAQLQRKSHIYVQMLLPGAGLLPRTASRAAIRLGLPYAHDRSEPLAIRGNADTGYTADVVLAVTFKTPPPKDHHAR
jgi:hypothetical protein